MAKLVTWQRYQLWKQSKNSQVPWETQSKRLTTPQRYTHFLHSLQTLFQSSETELWPWEVKSTILLNGLSVATLWKLVGHLPPSGPGLIMKMIGLTYQRQWWTSRVSFPSPQIVWLHVVSLNGYFFNEHQLACMHLQHTFQQPHHYPMELLFINTFIHILFHLSTHPPLLLPIYPSIHSCAHLSIIHPLIHPSIQCIFTELPQCASTLEG